MRRLLTLLLTVTLCAPVFAFDEAAFNASFDHDDNDCITRDQCRLTCTNVCNAPSLTAIEEINFRACEDAARIVVEKLLQCPQAPAPAPPACGLCVPEPVTIIKPRRCHKVKDPNWAAQPWKCRHTTMQAQP